MATIRKAKFVVVAMITVEVVKISHKLMTMSTPGRTRA